MKEIKITQIKSAIGSPKVQKRTVLALGIKKLNQSKVHKATPQILGMVNKVRHLVKVEEV
ncbi:MAG: 50S ribosomal protein L30 [Calditrichaceae bacterium]|nr:50S ribosomal protein L30 [Calditrichaceae bacterium]